MRGPGSPGPHDQDRQAEDEGEVRATLPSPLPPLHRHDQDKKGDKPSVGTKIPQSQKLYCRLE